MKKIITLTLIAMLTACQQAPVGYKPEPFAFELAPNNIIGVNVAEIRVIETYQAPMRRPNVEQDFPVPPASAVKKWVAKRLRATGQKGVLEITISDASVKEAPLPKTPGLKGLFTDDQDARYDAKLAVNFSLRTGTQNLADATSDVAVTRSQSINEKATVDDRARLYHTMTREMMASFDHESEARLHQYFAAFLR